MELGYHGNDRIPFRICGDNINALNAADNSGGYTLNQAFGTSLAMATTGNSCQQDQAGICFRTGTSSGWSDKVSDKAKARTVRQTIRI